MKGELLQELRRDKGLSQKELGALLSVSPFTISSYECGHSDPDDEAKVKLAKIFDISVDYLLGLVREPCSYRRDASYVYRRDERTIQLPAGFSPQEVQLVRQFVAFVQYQKEGAAARRLSLKTARHAAGPRQVRKPAGGLFWSALAKCQPPAVPGGVKRLSLSVSSEAGWYSTPKRCSTQREGPRLREAGQVMQDTELFSAS